ncbi:MAG: glycine--tRNA ligase subunit beta [Campylobacter sp.]|nr:glycine--tRNA ligase subunit beta [Campylobacter sp.]
MSLLIEIGVEELPAIPFLKEYPNIAPKWQSVLKKFKLDSEFKLYFTPRRIVIFHKSFASKQDDFITQKIGAPKAVALKGGEWSKAASSFAQKNGLSLDELEFKVVDGKEVLYHEELIKGQSTDEVLPEMVSEFLGSLHFGKTMKWGSGEYSFIRPVRSLMCLLDDKNVDMEIYGVKSASGFLPHRDFSYNPIKISSADEYFVSLKTHGIILDPKDREAKILDEFNQIQKIHGIEIEIDKTLLDEVVAITEYPTAVVGEFESEFLSVPKEVIIISMKENQRYFPAFSTGNLSNKFVAVINSLSSDTGLIIKGNEKVLRARLSDAMFFYKIDNEIGLKPEKLKNVTYMKELGSMWDKTLREIEVAKELCKIYSEKLSQYYEDYKSDIIRAITLSKADLCTNMVGEFSELQGIMGAYYAKNMGEKDKICTAIKEQYLPTGEQSELPSTLLSAVVALSCKLDSLMGLFSINKIPTGTKDPYALRRASLGVLKIALDNNLKFDIDEILRAIAPNYEKFNLDKLKNFIFDRIYTLYDINPSIIKACLRNSDVRCVNSAILALNDIVNEDGFEAKFDTFKRLANIIKDEKIGEIDESLLELDAEKELFSAYMGLSVTDADIYSYLQELFSLKDNIDKFFDEVMINVDNQAIKNNRIAIIGAIYNSFLKIADIKEISFN